MDSGRLRPIGQLLQALTESSSECAVSTGRSTPPEIAVERAKLLASCYRKDDAADPEVYAGAIASILSQYPADVVQRVTDPRSGIPSRLQWLPSVKEVRDACEEIDGHQRRLDAMLERERKQIEERKKDDAAKAKRPTLDGLKAKYGPNWGLSAAEKQDLIVKAARDETMKRANNHAFAEECKAAGMPADSAISPTLRKLLETGPAGYANDPDMGQ